MSILFTDSDENPADEGLDNATSFSAGSEPREGGPGADAPRELAASYSRSDLVFRGTARGIGIFVLVLTGSIGLFLGYQAIPTMREYGLHYFVEQQWLPAQNKLGIAAVVVGTIEVASVALIVGFPIALLTALFISEYAPARLKSWLIAMIDLMAAIPSIIYGLWGAYAFMPQAIYVSRWLSQHFNWIPFFHYSDDANSASWAQADFTGSAFIAGVVVAMMVVPLACSIMRGVFDQAPIGEREAAYALGSTKWGMIRSVVLPFGRGGIIGGTMMAMGRALGETVAVLMIISTAYDIKLSVLTSGTQTISALIANLFGEATNGQLSALLTAGFVLFLMTLGVNTVAAIFVNRSRSGAGADA